jgi:DNA repair exonuclease SbcCD nuclease subunit
MSDVHIGAFRQPELRGLVLSAFEAALDRCIGERVDFVIMAGDIFDSNIPDLGAVRRAAAKMREAANLGIRFYAIYGSHDFSPNYSSIVDVLDGAGLFTKAEVKETAEKKVSLRFIKDPSGAKICGISGRKLSLDREEYAVLDREALESAPGFKIFVFHGGIDELKPRSLEMMETMPASYLPAGFNYYAGGHIHDRTLGSLPGRRNIAYPGPLFATDYTELLQLAHGERRGFYIVDFDEHDVLKTAFIPVNICEVVELRCSAEGKSSVQVMKELVELADRPGLGGKVVLLTVEGQLGEGKTSDVNFQTIRKRLSASNPLVMLLNQSHFNSREMVAVQTLPKGPRLVEREAFERNISAVKSEVAELRGEKGVSMAVGLLKTLREARKENEGKSEFEERTTRNGLSVLGLEET